MRRLWVWSLWEYWVWDGGGSGGSCVLINNCSITPFEAIWYTIGEGGSYFSVGPDTVFGSITAKGGNQPPYLSFGGYNIINNTYTYGGWGSGKNGGSTNSTRGWWCWIPHNMRKWYIISIKAGNGGNGITIKINDINYSYRGGAVNTTAGYGGIGGCGNGDSPNYTGSLLGGKLLVPGNGTANTCGGGWGLVKIQMEDQVLF